MQWLPHVGQAAHGGVRLQLLLGHARRWASGERPDRVGFRVGTKWEERECGVSGETYADAAFQAELGMLAVAKAREWTDRQAAPALPGTAPLPEVLRAVADEALGFLKDGHHVLLAGAPGTGKTTVAQWVAHAWNAGADRVPAEAVAALLAPRAFSTNLVCMGRTRAVKSKA